MISKALRNQRSEGGYEVEFRLLQHEGIGQLVLQLTYKVLHALP